MNALKYFKWRLRHELPVSRVLITFFLMGLFSFSLIHPLLNIAQKLGIRVSPFAYPLVSNNPVTRLAMLSPALVLALGTSLRKETHALMLQKFTKGAVMGGSILYMMAAVLFFQLLFIFFSIIWLLPVTSWALEWGSGWRLLADPNTSAGFHRVFLPNALLMDNATAMGACTIAFLMDGAMLLLIWLILEIGSIRGYAQLGPLAAMIILVMDMALYNTYPVAFRKISPVSLSMLSTYYGEMERASGITMGYGLTFLAALMMLVLFLYFFSLRSAEKRSGESVHP